MNPTHTPNHRIHAKIKSVQHCHPKTNREIRLDSSIDHPLEANAINRLVCPTSRKTVGIEYLWNTGITSILWKNSPVEEFERVSIDTPNLFGE